MVSPSEVLSIIVLLFKPPSHNQPTHIQSINPPKGRSILEAKKSRVSKTFLPGNKWKSFNIPKLKQLGIAVKNIRTAINVVALNLFQPL